MIPTGLPAELIPHMFYFCLTTGVIIPASRGFVNYFLILFMFLAEAVFLARADALDVGAVHVDDHAAHDERTHHADRKVPCGKALEQAVNKGQHRIGGCHRDAAQRDHAGGDEAEQEDCRQKGQQDGLDGQNGTARHQNALAALEAEIDGLGVADDRKDRRHIDAEVRRDRRIRRQEAEQPPPDADRRHAFEHIARRREGSGLFAKGAQHVGHARRAAAVVADIVVVEALADQNAGVDTAQQIGLCSGGEDDEDRHHQSPPYTSFAPTEPLPRSRITSRIGVCSRPKFSRIWLMR